MNLDIFYIFIQILVTHHDELFLPHASFQSQTHTTPMYPCNHPEKYIYEEIGAERKRRIFGKLPYTQY
jgi:hypothetical protein